MTTYRVLTCPECRRQWARVPEYHKDAPDSPVCWPCRDKARTGASIFPVDAEPSSRPRASEEVSQAGGTPSV